jgi:hypothetical protein
VFIRGSDFRDERVNGRADLLDFFPVWLDIGPPLDKIEELLGTGGTIKIKLSHDADALNYVTTGLSTNNAGSYLVSEVAGLASAATRKITREGTALPDAFVDSIRADPAKGIILIEGRAATSSPLVLEIWREGKKLVKLEMPLRVAPVEDFYRWLNIRAAAGGAVSRPSRIGTPSGFPDTESNGRHFVFVHGYSVHEESARAWGAEMFKRLWQSGSKAMFTAVTWRGNDGQLPGWLPWANGSTPDYYVNVGHAFATAPALAGAVNSLPGVKVVAGHSLGNMLVSSAIADHGMGADKYFMLNAAVAMEAYDSAVSHASTMRHPDWQGYDSKLWASGWHACFPPGDGRSALTWKDRFGDIPNAVNYYSSTEDVLANSDGALHNALKDEYAWVNQEMLKGTTLAWLGPMNAEAGWKFNEDYDVVVPPVWPNNSPTLELMPPAQANLLPLSVLATNSFFEHFDDEALYGINGGAVAAQPAVRAQLLADAIPALSNPAGGNPITSWDTNPTIQRNHDMHGMRNGWPQERMKPNDAKRDRWLHSDIKNIAFPFVYGVFEQISNEGGLNQ